MDALTPVTPGRLATGDTGDTGTYDINTSSIWCYARAIPRSMVNFLSGLELPDDDTYPPKSPPPKSPPPKSPLPVVTDTSLRWEHMHKDQEPDSKKAQWSKNNCSRNIRIEVNPRLLYRHPNPDVTDVAISKEPFTQGMHIINIHWPLGLRGTHAVLGVALQDIQKQSTGYVNLLGNNQKSWGWDLIDNKLLFDNKAIATYPECSKCSKCSKSTEFKAPDNIRCILNMDKGVLGFEADGSYLGDAFTGLAGRKIHIAASVVWGRAKIGIQYITGFDKPSPRGLQEECKLKILKYLQYKEQIEDLPLPEPLKAWLRV